MEHTLTTTVEPDGLCVTLKFSGDLTEDKGELFKSDLLEAGKLIADSFRAKQHKIKVLLDMTDFSGNYSATNLTALAQFAKQNEPFVIKTASFGGTEKVKIAGEIAIALSARDNIKIFDKKADALEWLQKQPQ